tara:strand:+ start:86 stop:457 length:372 start_codon:yes stop_codon:yes gene_type:complete
MAAGWNHSISRFRVLGLVLSFLTWKIFIEKQGLHLPFLEVELRRLMATVSPTESFGKEAPLLNRKAAVIRCWTSTWVVMLHWGSSEVLLFSSSSSLQDYHGIKSLKPRLSKDPFDFQFPRVFK